MTDFIDRLEEQLVTAHARRRRLPALVPAVPLRTLAGVAAAAAAAVVLVVVLAGSGGAGRESAGGPATGASAGASSSPAPRAATAPSPATPAPAQTTVAVLNATHVAGLARAASDRLTRAGYVPGVVTNLAIPSKVPPVSRVLYTRGHRAAAEAVARREHVRRVAAIGRSMRTLAGEDADVVVVVGVDHRT